MSISPVRSTTPKILVKLSSSYLTLADGWLFPIALQESVAMKLHKPFTLEQGETIQSVYRFFCSTCRHCTSLSDSLWLCTSLFYTDFVQGLLWCIVRVIITWGIALGWRWQIFWSRSEVWISVALWPRWNRERTASILQESQSVDTGEDVHNSYKAWSQSFTNINDSSISSGLKNWSQWFSNLPWQELCQII